MGLMLVGTAGGATTFTAPPHKVGDLFIAFAFRDGSATNPTIGTAGWTSITSTLDGSLCSVSAAYKIATTTTETSGTWSNATRIICIVYRGQQLVANPLGTFTSNSGTSDPINYAPINLATAGIAGSSWFVAFVGHRSVNTGLEIPPTNMVLRENDVDANCEISVFDTGGYATQDWPSTDVTIGGSASGWITAVVEVKAQPISFNNYMFASVSVGNTGIMSVTEKIR